ncbi:MAG TPA: YdcF family protein [Deinococcales bacterium]|nr:YdcF family protein [Deinococcales bacterium]
MTPEEQAARLNTIASFLAARDVERPEDAGADLVALLGSAVLAAAEAAALAALAGETLLLVCGGVGHSTPYLWENVRRHPVYGGVPVDGRPEAEVLRDIVVHHLGVPGERLLLEARSTNCGDNAVQARRVLAEHGLRPRTVLLVQDPTMQRRTDASFRQAWGDDTEVRFVNHAPFVPRLKVDGNRLALTNGRAAESWTVHRFVSLVLGEVPRLRDDESGYGPRGRGFIAQVDVPPEVEEAHAALVRDLGGVERLL